MPANPKTTEKINWKTEKPTEDIKQNHQKNTERQK